MKASIKLRDVSLNYEVRGLETMQLSYALASMVKRKRSEKNVSSGHVYALKNINLELNEGDRLGLIGHNGAGKSTLLKMLNGIYHPSSGTCEVTGRITSLLDMGLGMDENATGYENIFLTSYLRGYNKKEIQSLTEGIIEFADIGDFIFLPMRTYSSGMRARLAFAIATALIPDVLLIDEVFGTGDADFINKSIERMTELMNGARILVFASHSTELVQQFCNKAILLDHGEIITMGPVDEVNETYKHRLSA